MCKCYKATEGIQEMVVNSDQLLTGSSKGNLLIENCGINLKICLKGQHMSIIS